MSLAEFQRAFADLVASPQRCLTARRDLAHAFARYEVTDRERARLEALVLDEGMSSNCTLYRVNRLIPLYGVLRLTCAWLGSRLMPELDAYWASSQEATLQFRREAWRFGEWLQRRVSEGGLDAGPIQDALAFELAAFDVRNAANGPERGDAFPHPRKRLLRFVYDPTVVLSPPAVTEQRFEPSGREEWVLLDAAGPSFRVLRLTAEVGRRLASAEPERASSDPDMTCIQSTQ